MKEVKKHVSFHLGEVQEQVKPICDDRVVFGSRMLMGETD